MTFSLPPIIKYPPTSNAHSPFCSRVVPSGLFKTQFSPITIIGIRPKLILLNISVLIVSISKVSIGCCGGNCDVISFSAPGSICILLPLPLP